jgi:hypothetical protein
MENVFMNLKIFMLSSMMIYGAVVFNYGTAARYRFPFVLLFSLFASENNTMMGMDKEKCMAMHKSMHENSTNNQLEKEPSVIKKYEELLNSKNSEYGG